MFFFAGRYEFGNKGVDVIIKALGKLNQKLKEKNTSRSVSVFFWIPMSPQGIKFELLENKNYSYENCIYSCPIIFSLTI